MTRYFKKTTNTASTLTTDDQPRESFKVLVSWKAPSHIFKKRDRSWYTTIGVIVFVLILIATLAQEFLAIGVILAFCFVYFVLSSTQPGEVEHKITTEGVVTSDFSYTWEELSGFWFDKKQELEILVLETKKKFPPNLILLLDKVDRELIKEILSRHLMFWEKPKTSFAEKVGNFLSKKVPIQTSR